MFMKKTKSLFKKFTALLLTLSIGFGYSIVPVMAMENDQDNDVVVEGLANEEVDLQTEEEITDKEYEQISTEEYVTVQAPIMTVDNSLGIDEVQELLDKANSLVGILGSLGESITEYDSTLTGYSTRLESIKTSDKDESESLDTLKSDISGTITKVTSDLKTKLNSAYTELSTKASNEDLQIPEYLKTVVSSVLESLKGDTVDLVNVTSEYFELVKVYNDSVLSYANTGLKEKLEANIKNVFETTLTKEKYDEIVNNVTEGFKEKLETNITNVETLKSYLKEKYTVDDATLEAFINLNNSKVALIDDYNSFKSEIDGLVIGDTSAADQQLMDTLSGIIELEVYNIDYADYLAITSEEQQQILSKLNITEEIINSVVAKLIPDTENTTRVSISNLFKTTKDYFSKSFDNTLSSLKVNNTELNVDELEHTVYVGNDVTKLDLEYITSDKDAVVEISDNAYDLQVGENIVYIWVMAPNGTWKTYTIKVIREEAKKVAVQNVEQTNSTDTTSNVVMLSNKVTNDSSYEEAKDDEVKSNTSDSKDKYNEEVKEDEGLSWWLVLIIVILIAVIAFIIYKLFGDKDDQNFDKVFMNSNTNKKVDQKKNNVSNNKKKNKK